MFSLNSTWINGLVNSGEAGDLRCHRAHYDVTVMTSLALSSASSDDKTHNWLLLKCYSFVSVCVCVCVWGGGGGGGGGDS